jgi:putative ABC transport system permease protein
MFFFLQIVFMALRGLRANLLRSLLATLGVIIGVGAVISAMSILEGTQRDIVQRFESMGSDTITIYPTTAKSGGRSIGTVQTLTLSDADKLSNIRVCPNVAAAAPEVSTILACKYFGRNKEATLLGTSESYADMFNYKVKAGEYFNKEDVNAEQKVVVLGHKIAEDLFGNAPPVGQAIKMKGMSFRVIGVMEKKGNIGFRNVDSQVMVPVTTAMKRIMGIDSLQAITIKAKNATQVDAAQADVKRELRRAHKINIRSGQKDDFLMFSQEESLKQVGEVTKLFGLVLGSIAGISLVVGGIGIMNIMLVSVTERTREIGVRMAVGAQRWDVLRQFLIEASVISLLGGAFGVALSYAMNHLLEQTTRVIETYTTMRIIVYAITMAVMTGIISGIYPAYKASRLDPVEALRYE